jgi:hypothetical protein
MGHTGVQNTTQPAVASVGPTKLPVKLQSYGQTGCDQQHLGHVRQQEPADGERTVWRWTKRCKNAHRGGIPHVARVRGAVHNTSCELEREREGSRKHQPFTRRFQSLLFVLAGGGSLKLAGGPPSTLPPKSCVDPRGCVERYRNHDTHKQQHPVNRGLLVHCTL